MAKKMKVWFDKEGDFVEIGTTNKKGFFKDIGNDIFERVDRKGNVIGFAIFNFSKRSKLKEEEINLPFEFSIKSAS